MKAQCDGVFAGVAGGAQNSTTSRWGVRASLLSVVLGLVGCTSSSSTTNELLVAPPGPGVIFTYPVNGQFDVPSGTQLVLTFSDPITAPTQPADAGMGGFGTCTRSPSEPAGKFCVDGPDGLVDGTVIVDGTRLAFSPAGGFAPGGTYRVYARPELLAGSTNLPQVGPLLTFRVRSQRTVAGAPASLLTLNGQPLLPDGGASAPFLNEAPVRLLFSEPLDLSTVTPQNVTLVHVADGAAVEGTALCDGIHLTFQPTQALVPGDAYEFVMSSAVLDVGGEAIAPVQMAFTARRMAVPDAGLYPMPLAFEPAWIDGVSQPKSKLSPMPANSNLLSAPLLGTNTMGVTAGGLDSLVGDPQVMGTPIPMLMRRGQHLSLTPMAIRFGGVLNANDLTTGNVHFTLLADAVGFMMRNPLRNPDQNPDDAQAPVYIDFTMDAVVTSDDPRGHVLATQTVLGIRLYGLGNIDGNQLAVEQVGAMDFSTLGVNVAPVNLAMRLRTGARAAVAPLAAPVLLSSIPPAGATSIAPDERIELNFSTPIDPARLRDGLDVKLTQGATAIPVTTRIDGATVIVTPSKRLAEGAATTLTYGGLQSFAGEAIASGTLAFTTATVVSGKEAPAIITAIAPGAPCALTGATATSAGRCTGGLDTDTGYQPFTLPANRDIRVQFSQVMNDASIKLGTACGAGSVRVEVLGANGACTGVVPGTLFKRDRQFRFQPSTPWTVGGKYRLTLVAGPDVTCDPGELCGRNKLTLNTDPIAGASDKSAGGPDIVIAFTATPATPDSYQPQESDAFADQNGNGLFDTGEVGNAESRVAMEIAGYTGFITYAAFSQGTVDCLPNRPGVQSCSQLHATLPVSVGAVVPNCPIDAQGKPSVAANPCIQVQVFPSAIVGTSVSMDSTAFGIIPVTDTATGMQVMRMRELGAPIFGYIMNEPGSADPQFVINQKLYFDAPDLEVPMATHDMHSKMLDATMKGPVTFTADGRMKTRLINLGDVSLSVGLSALGMPGTIDLLIPKGEMKVTLMGPPLR